MTQLLIVIGIGIFSLVYMVKRLNKALALLDDKIKTVKEESSRIKELIEELESEQEDDE